MDDIEIEDVTGVFLRDLISLVDVTDFGAVGDGAPALPATSSREVDLKLSLASLTSGSTVNGHHQRAAGLVRCQRVGERLDVPSSRVSAKLVDIYRKDTTPKEVFQNQELMQLNKNQYRQKGEGRPTKKERRDIDDYLDESE